MGKFLTVRVETASGSIYQICTGVLTQSTTVIRMAGAGAVRFLTEPEKVVRYQPIVIGKPLVITIDDGYGDGDRTSISTPVTKVSVWLTD